MDITQLRKSSRRSWRVEWEGKEILGLDSKISEAELPYFALNKQIDHLENMLSLLEGDSFRFPIINKQLKNAKLLFAFRYEWEFSTKAYPFKYKWIYYKYKELLSEGNLAIEHTRRL